MASFGKRVTFFVRVAAPFSEIADTVCRSVSSGDGIFASGRLLGLRRQAAMVVEIGGGGIYTWGRHLYVKGC